MITSSRGMDAKSKLLPFRKFPLVFDPIRRWRRTRDKLPRMTPSLYNPEKDLEWEGGNRAWSPTERLDVFT